MGHELPPGAMNGSLADVDALVCHRDPNYFFFLEMLIDWIIKVLFSSFF
jgi:hypothetical protein